MATKLSKRERLTLLGQFATVAPKSLQAVFPPEMFGKAPAVLLYSNLDSPIGFGHHKPQRALIELLDDRREAAAILALLIEFEQEGYFPFLQQVENGEYLVSFSGGLNFFGRTRIEALVRAGICIWGEESHPDWCDPSL